MLEYRLLGPLEVLSDGEPVPLPRLKQRALLAALLLRAGEVVSVDRLIEDLWGWEAPPRAKQALMNYVSQLRKTLGPDTLTTRAPGYVFNAEPEQIDLARFERLLESAQSAAPADREARLRAALQLVRGRPLADLVFEPFAEREVARIEELALQAQEGLLEVELARGGHVDAVPGLTRLIAQHPYRERLRGMLMLALYRAGRQAEALEAYQDARRTLVDGLGIEPGEELQELERAILRQDESLRAPAPPQEPVQQRPARPTRKLVTVLVSAYDGSLLSESLDAEPARAWLDRIALVALSVAERHDGRVDRTGTDIASLVFGVPTIREHDALRAARAATELRDELLRLDNELAARHGLRLRPRVGLATGDVHVAEDLAVVGEPVSAATRLAVAAAAGDVVVGATTLALVRHAVAIEDTGGGTPRLVGIAGDDRRPLRLDAPLVGRERQLAVLRHAFEGSVADRRLYLVTVVGAAGVGKSRLVREFSLRLGDDASRLTAHCTAYGEQVGFGPLLELLSGVVVDDPTLVARRESLVEALRAGGFGVREETFRATRTLLEALARRSPLVLVVDDVHAASADMLDLIDDLADWSTGAPILVVCTARPELLELRASWSGGKASSTSLVLEALDDTACLGLVDSLLGESDLPEPVLDYIVAASGGNPLFVEELLATLVEREVLTRDAGRWTSKELPAVAIPSSVTSLLAARIDRLPGHERELLDLAAACGHRFTSELLTGLADDDLARLVDAVIASLVRKELIRPVDDLRGTFEFRHELLRDVAYASLPKRARAELHEKLAELLVDSGDPGSDARFHRATAQAYLAELGAEASPPP